MTSAVTCVNDHDDFCFVCGHRLVVSATSARNEAKKRYVTAPKFSEAYKAVFNFDPAKRNVKWSPSVFCTSCYNQLTIPARKLHILTPMEWMEPKDHPNDCYFCQTKMRPLTTRRRQAEIEYANVSSVKKAKFIPTSSDTSTIYDEEEEDEGGTESRTMPNFDEFELDEASALAAQGGSSTEYVADTAMDLEDDMPAPIDTPSTSTSDTASNLGAYSDQHGERFHQDIKVMEKRYKGKNYIHMLGDHCWRLVREAPDAPWSRKSPLNYFNKKRDE